MSNYNQRLTSLLIGVIVLTLIGLSLSSLLNVKVRSAGVLTVTVVGTTSTQAILSYTAPDSNLCTVEVSESSSYAPLVHDINPALFTGSNLDNREGSVTADSSRIIILGTRTAQKASDGVYYSRALKAYTTHYFRITCGSNVGTGSFQTSNIPIGKTRGEPIQADPNNPGMPLQPTVPTTRGASVIDPRTGAEMRLLSTSGDVSGMTTTYSLGASAAQFCSPIKVQTSDGKWGHHCLLYSNGGHLLFWVGDNGEIRMLAITAKYWDPPTLPTGQDCGTAFDPQDPNKFYCLYPGTTVLVRGTYHGHSIAGADLGYTSLPVQQMSPQLITWDYVTTDLGGLMREFNPAYYGSSNWSPEYGWSLAGQNNGLLVFVSWASIQDSYGWEVVFDPTKKDNTPHTAGCVNGGTGCVVGMINSFNGVQGSRNRWCGIHSAGFALGPWLLMSSTGPGFAAGVRGGGPYRTSNVSLPSCSTVNGTCNTCPANDFGVTGNQCSTITITGNPVEPYDSQGQQPLPGDYMIEPVYPQERMRILTRTGSAPGPYTMVVQRSADGANSVPAYSGTLSMACPQADLWWNWQQDPYGQNVGSNMRKDPDLTGGHFGYLDGTTVEVNAWPEKGYQTWLKARVNGSGNYPPPLTSGVNVNYYGVGSTFAGRTGLQDPNTLQTHLALLQSTASAGDKQWVMDARTFAPFGGWGTSVAKEWSPSTASLVNGTAQIYKVPGTGLQRKWLDTIVTSGNKLFADISGPSSVISDGSAGAYKYCVALKAGECMTGSSAGDIYANVPNLQYNYCFDSFHNGLKNDLCIWNLSQYGEGISQIGFQHPYNNGELGRVLSYGFGTYQSESVFWNVSTLPDGLSGIISSGNVNGTNSIFQLKFPPFPAEDAAVDRSTFVPAVLNLTPPSGQNITKAVVEFGYKEYGNASDHFCTSRKEACVTASGSIDPNNPYAFAGEAYAPTACVGNCTIVIPTIPQRVTYFIVKYLDANNNVVATQPGVAEEKTSVMLTASGIQAPATYTVSGTISGLSGTVVLQNNGGDNFSKSSNGSFTFATALSNGSDYKVTVLTQPAGQICTVTNGSGTISSANVTNVSVSCTSSDTTAPSVPQNLSATAVSSSQVNLSWTGSADDIGVTGYNIYRNGAKVGTADTNSYSDTGLAANTTYTYIVSAYDAVGNTSALSAPATAATPAPSPLPVISNLLVTNIATSTATVSWTTNVPTNAAINYGLTTSYGSAVGPVDIDPLTTTHTIVLTNLTPASTYHFQAASADGWGSQVLYQDQTFTTQSLPNPAPPAGITNLSVSNTTRTSTVLSWTAPGSSGNSGTAFSYDIRYCPSPITSANWNTCIQLSGEPNPALAGTSQSYNVVGLSSGTKYYFGMKTTNSSGLTSALSNIVTVMTKRKK